MPAVFAFASVATLADATTPSAPAPPDREGRTAMAENTNQGTADIGVVGMAVMNNLAGTGRHRPVQPHVLKTQDVVAEHGHEGTSFPARRGNSSRRCGRRRILMVKGGRRTGRHHRPLLPTWSPATSSSTAEIRSSGHPLARARLAHEPELHRVRHLRRRGGCSGGPLDDTRRPRTTTNTSAQSWKISAQYEGEPCCTWIGTDGAGHS